MFRKSASSGHQFLWRQLASRRTTISSLYPATSFCGHRHLLPTTTITVPQHRHFSDRLLGHSPMAPATPGVPQEESRIPTARDVEIAGGIWNPSSAKRDRIAELKVELTEDQYTLDDAATDQQMKDLFLADGIQWIVHAADTTGRLEEEKLSSSSTEEETKEVLPRELDPSQWDTEPTLLDVQNWMTEQETIIQTTTDGVLNQQQWETYLDETMQKIEEQLATLPSGRYLRHVRDFYTVPDDTKEALTEMQSEISASEDQHQLMTIANKCVARYRLQLTRASCEHLKESWDKLSTLTDEALDRLAVKTEGHESTDQIISDGKLASLSLTNANKVLQSCLVGNATDRFDAWWEMVDKNGDGLLEKTEMEQVAFSTVTPVQSAIVSLFEEALEASPVRDKAATEDESDGKKGSASANSKKPGWLERRREKKAKKRLLATFQRATKKHFEDEIEMPHRLRCIYAWAEKEHQDNQIDSVLIEASGWTGRKRYVELPPKISLPEFREVQEIHLTHLERIGWEITKSFREDLLVEQGKGRQNAELKRDCMVFLLVVSLVDYAIIIF